MPGTDAEFVALVNLVAAEVPTFDIASHRWADGTGINQGEIADLRALATYALGLIARRKVAQSAPQRKARRLLRSLLSASQLRSLRRSKCFVVVTPGGSTYRLDPRYGTAERVEKHGRRYFVRAGFCLHDEKDSDAMPPADVTIGHMLLLLADEAMFLATANHNRRDDQLWNGDYLRRLRVARENRGTTEAFVDVA